VLIVQVPIHGKAVEIDTKQVHQAVLPLYPTNEEGYLVDLNEIPAKETANGYWDMMTSALRDQLGQNLKVGERGRRPKNISVFALAPIPLLVLLGAELGDKGNVNLYQKHRQGPRPWNWREEDEKSDWYQVNKWEGDTDSEDIALVLSISDNVNKLKYKDCFKSEFTTYEIKAKEPRVDFLKSKQRLDAFACIYRKTLCEIRDKHSDNCKIHLLPAVPAPVAITCGQSLLPKVDPVMLVYEYHKNSSFKFALQINHQ
jgi:hypothetical protein